MTIIGVYLPPENSFHGRDGNVVFNYINLGTDRGLGLQRGER